MTPEPGIAAITPMGDHHLRVRLRDERELVVPRAPFRRLRGASDEQLLHYELTLDGEGAYWPDLDEDISIRGFRRYAEVGRAVESQLSAGEVAYSSTLVGTVAA